MIDRPLPPTHHDRFFFPSCRLSFPSTMPRRRMWRPLVASAGRVLAPTPMEVLPSFPTVRRFPSCDRFPARVPRKISEDGVIPMDILARSSHRDGSIYEGTQAWKTHYHIADRNETRLEAMKLTHPDHCIFLNGNCRRHPPNCMFQIFSLKLAKATFDGELVQLYGYIAVRDNLDSLLNYVVRASRDDPIIVEQGSSINMAGPKRGIDFCGNILIEYDMKIKTGEQEKHDPQLVDGASILRFKGLRNCDVFTNRINGDGGAIDITASGLEDAVEATIEVLLSEVNTGFNLCLRCFPSGLKEEIPIFDGAVSEPGGLKRSVAAVVIGSYLSLRFEVGSDSSNIVERQCSFRANNHGCSSQNIRTDFGLISVNVTWSALPRGH